MDTPVLLAEARVRRERFRVRGTVQGVGFRPFVYRIARELSLGGWVLNDSEGLLAEVQGPAKAVEAFARRLRDDLPPLASIDAIERSERSVEPSGAFTIAASRAGGAATPVTPDAATTMDASTGMDAAVLQDASAGQDAATTADAGAPVDPLAGRGNVEQVATGFMFTEGPQWDPARGVLFFCSSRWWSWSARSPSFQRSPLTRSWSISNSLASHSPATDSNREGTLCPPPTQDPSLIPPPSSPRSARPSPSLTLACRCATR